MIILCPVFGAMCEVKRVTSEVDVKSYGFNIKYWGLGVKYLDSNYQVPGKTWRDGCCVSSTKY